MPDFKAYVRENLPALGVSGEQEAEIVEELALEFQEHYERALRNGATRQEAWEEVRKHTRPWQDLGKDLRAAVYQPSKEERERAKQTAIARYIDDLRQDFRYAARQLKKSPGFTCIAVLTLALGIGANTGIFSLMNAVLLRMLPIPDPQQLVFLGNARSEGQTGFLANGRAFSYAFYKEFLQKNDAFSNVAAVNSIMFQTYGRIDNAEPEPIKIDLVSGTFFKTLGVGSIHGRVLEESDDRTPGAHPVAVANYSWWQRRFAQDPAIIGKKVRLGTMVYDIVGVAPPGFFGVTVGRSPDLWIPLAMQKQISPGWNGLENKRFQTLHVFGRIKSGTTEAQAHAGTNVRAKQILLEHGSIDADERELDRIRQMNIELTPATTGRSSVRAQFSSPLKVLMIVVALVLIIACANVANLLLTRATARRHELAIRMSLGAVRWRLIRQLFLESGVLALSGAILGIVFAWSTSRVLLSMVSAGPELLPIQVAPDSTVLAFTLVITILAAVLFGTAPAVSATRFDAVTSLSGVRGAGSNSARNRLARILIVGQVALSLVLLVSAGLFLRSFSNLIGTDIGFDKENVLLTSIEPGAAGYQVDERLQSMMRRVEEAVRAIPGVEGASFAFHVFDNGSFSTDIKVPGREGSRTDPLVVHQIVGPDYLQIMKMPLLLGRQLDLRDTATSRKVAVINEMMASTYFTGTSPLGRTFSLEDETGWEDIEVVGVVKDAKYLHLYETPMPAAFYSHAQFRDKFLYPFVVRYTGDPTFLARDIRAAVRDVNPDLPVGNFTTLSKVVDGAAQNKRIVAQLSMFFGILAAFLAAIGIYGVLSYSITRRTGEFGIRMALGAQRPQVIWVVLREALWLGVIGVTIGLVVSRASSSVIQSLLFGIDSDDPTVLGIAILAMIAVALFAGYLPARRATRIDPMVALRHE